MGNVATEIVKVTSRVGDTITFVRAQEGTSAANFPSGSAIELRITAQSVIDAISTGTIDASRVGYTPPGTGAVSLDLEEKANERISIINFGAVGDGVTDNTTAINNALAYAKTVKGVVEVPLGTFAVTGRLIVDSGVRGLVGLGGTLKYTSSSAMILLRGKQSGAVANVFDFTMQDLYIDANDQVISYPNGSVAVIMGENVQRCSFINNVITNFNWAQGKGGIYLRSFLAGAAFTIYNRIIGNVITGENIATLANPDNGPCIAIDVLNAELNIAPYADPTAYWKATFTAATATYYAQWNTIADNVLHGGFYAISAPAAQYTTVTGNVMRNNIRGVSMQHCAKFNNVSNNVILQNISTAVGIAYGSTDNLVASNNMYSTVNTGEAFVEAYVGAKNNTFSDNQIRASGVAPRFYMYCAVQSDGCVFRNNTMVGEAARASIGVESAWNSATTNLASYAYGQAPALVNGFAGTGMSNIVIDGNVITNSAAVPAIFLNQQSDGAGNYALTECKITNNVVTNSFPNYQLEMAESTSGQSNNHILMNNSFYPTEDGPGYYLWARGREMFRVVSGNSPINSNISVHTYASGDTTPNVAYNDYVSLAAYATPTTVTNFTGGQEGQVITVRLASTVTIQNNANIVLKGGVNITGVTSNDYVRLMKRDATTWTELSRSF
jgi:LysM repeat protein